MLNSSLNFFLESFQSSLKISRECIILRRKRYLRSKNSILSWSYDQFGRYYKAKSRYVQFSSNITLGQNLIGCVTLHTMVWSDFELNAIINVGMPMSLPDMPHKKSSSLLFQLQNPKCHSKCEGAFTFLSVQIVFHHWMLFALYQRYCWVWRRFGIEYNIISSKFLARSTDAFIVKYHQIFSQNRLIN